MSEPILAPIKASEELPKEDGSYIIYNNKTGYDIYFFEVGWSEDFWLKRHQLWYKPVSVDEYKKEIILNFLNWYYSSNIAGTNNKIITENYIKSKLTEK